MNGLTEEFGERLPVVRLDAGERENRRLQDNYGVRGHPSFVVLDGDGAVVERFFGPQEATALREAMQTVAP